MNTLFIKTQKDIENEIQGYAQEIKDLNALLHDYKRMQAGDFNRTEILQDIKDAREQMLGLIYTPDI